MNGKVNDCINKNSFTFCIVDIDGKKIDHNIKMMLLYCLETLLKLHATCSVVVFFIMCMST